MRVADDMERDALAHMAAQDYLRPGDDGGAEVLENLVALGLAVCVTRRIIPEYRIVRAGLEEIGVSIQ